MTQIIVLAGLVVQEKINLTLALARHFAAQGQTVAVLDNIARLSIASDAKDDLPPSVTVQRLATKTVSQQTTVQIQGLVDEAGANVILLATSETTPPETLFGELEWLRSTTTPVQSLALIDTRTCDCFPHVRQQLEAYADTIVQMPYSLTDVLDDISHDVTS